MSVNMYSPEAINLGGTTRSPPEIGEEAAELTVQNLEPEPEKSESESEWVTPPWELKPFDQLKESDFAVYDNHPHPFIHLHKNFTYKNQAMLDHEKALAEFKERARNLDAWDIDAIPIPASLGLCGGVREYVMTEDERPHFSHLSNLSLQKYIGDNQGAVNFVFDEFVKANKNVGSPIYYITFTAKDGSNNSSTKTFQAKVHDHGYDNKGEPMLLLIRLKPT